MIFHHQVKELVFRLVDDGLTNLTEIEPALRAISDKQIEIITERARDKAVRELRQMLNGINE